MYESFARDYEAIGLFLLDFNFNVAIKHSYQIIHFL